MKRKALGPMIFQAIMVLMLATGCSTPSVSVAGQKKVIAAETFLMDMAKNIGGERIAVDSLVPAGTDPHTYEPTPRDGARIAESDLVIVNGAELESWIEPLLKNVGAEKKVVVASEGLKNRSTIAAGRQNDAHGHSETDPHFWLDPKSVLIYIENIRKALEVIDPVGKETYANNYRAYSHLLEDLDLWISLKTGEVPVDRRLFVTNHESLGYFADRYGFKIVGTVIPSSSTEATPTAKQISVLIEQIKQLNVPAIFLETGANPQLAIQIERETGAKVVLDLNTHSVDKNKTGQTSYIEMMKTMVETIVQALQ